MPVTGPLDHIDLSVGDSVRSIAFYDAFFTALGYRRWPVDHPDFTGERPQRAAWALQYAGGAWFSVEVRPAHEDKKTQRYDRYAPGPHHLAFHAGSRATVDAVHAALVEAGGKVLDAPFDYSGHEGYGDGYYAAFFADPDGLKLEVVHLPSTNA